MRRCCHSEALFPNSAEMEDFLQNERLLMRHVTTRLRKQTGVIRFLPIDRKKGEKTAAVLFLMGMCRSDSNPSSEACLIFNLRSRYVRQPGDLCFPGGGFSPFLDGFLAGLLRVPGLPLSHRALWRQKNQTSPAIPPGLSRMLATGLRESFEEMRLNPFRVHFLGPLMPERFERFNRIIYPMVAWTSGQNRFVPNWEVERIVPIPLRQFLHPGNYAKLPSSYLSGYKDKSSSTPMAEFPCLVYENGKNREVLWGLTYRIVMRFLDIVFEFKPPETASLPAIPKQWRT
jgi:hypothetical protein